MEEKKVFRGFGEQRRKAAKRELLNIMEQIGPTDGKTRALGLFSLRTGYAMKRAEEYLDELVAAGLVEVNGDSVTIVRSWQIKEEDKG